MPFLSSVKFQHVNPQLVLVTIESNFFGMHKRTRGYDALTVTPFQLSGAGDSTEQGEMRLAGIKTRLQGRH
jgi:hypothetical protein